MAKLTKSQIRQVALQIIAQTPQGIRFTELLKQIQSQHPETPINTISGSTYNLAAVFPLQVVKPSKGLYVSVTNAANVANMSSNGGVQPASGQIISSTSPQFLEKDFYQPFADFLEGELNEVTVAVPLGGAGLGAKWGTPDVVGIYKPIPSDRIKFDQEVVSAEIKINPQEAVTAFGQAVAYRLFSSKVYVVMPSSISKDDQNRLEALCMLFGVGFVVFDINKAAPNFVTRIRAQRFAPDMFYVNTFANGLHQHNQTMFNKLFQ